MSQCNNKDTVKYHISITDPDSAEYMNERIDVHIPEKGHTYLPNDSDFASGSSASKAWAIISDMWDWMDIFSKAARTNPFVVVEFPMSEQRAFGAYLNQFYTKGMRKSKCGKTVLMTQYHWHNYGKATEIVDGKEVVVSHPGEVCEIYS